MEKQVLIILTILLIISLAQCANIPSKPSTTRTTFIVKSCKNVTYPSLCIETLTPYASAIGKSPLKLCNVALTVAILGARNASSTVSKIAKQKRITGYEAKAIKDCIDDMKDTVYELKLTVNAMGHLNDPDKEFQWANAKTWASAAISDMDSCMDGLSDRKTNLATKKKIKSSIVGVQRLVSNALSLINHLY